MKTFSSYVEQKNLDALVSQIAYQMVEANVDPYDFLIGYYKSQPEMVIKLEGHKEENLNEFMQGLKNIAGAAWNAAKGVGQNVGTAAGALGQGLASTARQAKDDAFGPEAKYKVALQALKSLSDELGKNKEIQAAMQDQTNGPQIKKVVNDLMGISKQLEQQQQMVTDHIKRMKEKQTVTQTQATRGANPAAPVPGQQQPQQAQQQPQQAQQQTQQPQIQQFPNNNVAATA